METYGCTEVGPIGAECTAGSMHILATNVHIEIFRDGAPVPAGEFGGIVATSLSNRAMPLVWRFVRVRQRTRGRHLLLELARFAVMHGLSCFAGIVMRENRSILAPIARLGFATSYDSQRGLVKIACDLGELLRQPAALSRSRTHAA